MAVDVAVGDVLDQPAGTKQDSGDGMTYQIVRQGRYATLDTFTEGLKAKTVCNLGTTQNPIELYVVSWSLERLDGDYGRLTITVGEASDDSSSDPDEDVVSTKWSVKGVQQQIPLSRFAPDGTWSLGSAPDGHELSLWRQEPRKDLYDDDKFLAPDGNIYELSTGSKPVAAKYRMGIEAVMRFYPVVTRKITYKRGMSDTKVDALGIGERLSHIDTPDRTFGLTPGAWLCIQDDADEAADGTLVRITGWMGCKSLDADLYGDTNRWEPMAESSSSNSSSNSNPGGSE